MMKKLLLIDDDSELLESLTRLISAHVPELQIYTARDAEQAVSKFKEKEPQVVILDLSLNEREGVESGYGVLSKLLKLNPLTRVVVLTGHGDTEFGVRAIGAGASHFLEKPANINHLQVLIEDGFRFSHLHTLYRNLEENKKDALVKNITGTSALVEQVRSDVSYAASHNLPVFITGETGTGKGLCAKSIHELSERSTKRFVRYQPSASSGDLVRSELFGHKKGAFTGAEGERSGLIELANNGTLFLDEIDQFPIETQVFLLGAIQEKKFRAMGADEEKAIDFRLISATNADMDKVLEEEKFRKDLFHRISHLVIELPALRDRKEDIVPLARQALESLQSEHQLRVGGIEDLALARLEEHDWPGNIRELIALLENAAHRAQYEDSLEIKVQHLNIRGQKKSSLPNSSMTLHEQVNAFKENIAQKALDAADGNQVHAAKKLSVDRSTLRRILGL